MTSSKNTSYTLRITSKKPPFYTIKSTSTCLSLDPQDNRSQSAPRSRNPAKASSTATRSRSQSKKRKVSSTETRSRSRFKKRKASSTETPPHLEPTTPCPAHPPIVVPVTLTDTVPIPANQACSVASRATRQTPALSPRVNA